MSTKETGVAFIGAGVVAEMHGRGLAAVPDARLIGVYDPVAANARKIAHKFGGRVYGSLEALLDEKRVEAVHILTPVQHHVPVALKALSAGKHVLLEKPVAATGAEILQLRRAAERCGRICMPAHNYIYTPALRRAKRLVAEGRLGEIAALWITYNIHHPEEVAAQYEGVLRTVCVHHAYSLLYLLGRPRSVSASTSIARNRGLKTEDQAAICCEMPDGALAQLWASFAVDDPTSDPWTVLYKMLGTRGGMSYSWNEARYDDSGGPGWGLPCYEEGFRGEIEHFLTRVIRRGEPPLSTLADAADALRIIEAAERAARSGRRQALHYSRGARAARGKRS